MGEPDAEDETDAEGSGPYHCNIDEPSSHDKGNAGQIEDKDEEEIGSEDEEDKAEEDPILQQKVINDPILAHIRFYCVQNFERAEVVSALYHATQGKYLMSPL
jgi:hypothetical protein